MIINLIVNFIVLLIGLLFILFPVVHLPITISGGMLLAIGYWNSFMLAIPYLQVMWTATLWIIGFEMTVILVRFFFGSHSPVQ